MNTWKYSFEKYRGPASKHTCPACEHKRTFTRYVDESGNYLHQIVGRCDREDNCGYHYTPSEFFKDNPEKCRFSEPIKKRFCKPTKKDTSSVFQNDKKEQTDYLNKRYLINSIGYNSQLVEFLCSLFDRYTIESPSIISIMENYYLGQTKDRRVIYWQVDANNRVRTGKVMRYDPKTGRRTKNEKRSFDWVHSILIREKKLPESFSLSQCLFGEHLLKKYPEKTVCIVESEKSAILASVVWPEYVWLATGGKSNYNAEKCAVLNGRNVLVWPDVGAFDDWSKKTPEIEKQCGCKMVLVEALERIANEEDRKRGFDIADYIVRRMLDSSTFHSMKEPFTEEDRMFTDFVEVNKYLPAFFDALGLVSTATLNPLRLTR